MLFGIAVVVIGIVFLFQNMGWLPGNAWQIIWPALVILFGLSIMYGKSECCSWTKCKKGEK